MLSRSLSRVAKSTPPPTTGTTAAVLSTSRATSQHHAASCHQRRQSSSKTSCPPGSSRSSDPAADNTTNASAEDEKRSSSGRSSKRKSKDSAPAVEKAAASKAKEDPFARIPAVPPTNSLQLSDVHTSSFFSLHRPISVTTSIPPVDNQRTIERFNDIFKVPKQSNSSKHQPDDVIYTLSSALNAVESHGDAASSSGQGNRRGLQVVQLDGMPSHANLDDLIKNFRPFNAPPPPVPFDGSQKSNAAAQQSRAQTAEDAEEWQTLESEAWESSQALQSTQKPPRQSRKTFTTTLTIHETTSPSGQISYTASATPIRSKSHQDAEPVKARQPFLARMLERQGNLDEFLTNRAERDGKDMWAISVKRQRKLKMKKHKYKKLMRRTRVLRRNQGKA